MFPLIVLITIIGLKVIVLCYEQSVGVPNVCVLCYDQSVRVPTVTACAVL